MIRHATMFWVAVAGLFLTALTVVASEVRTRDHALNELHAAIAREQERIHVLKAERAYLASPERIAERARKELGFVEIGADRIMTIADLPTWAPMPELDIEPSEVRPLLLSALDGVGGVDDFVAAPFLPPPRLEAAEVLHQTAAALLISGKADE